MQKDPLAYWLALKKVDGVGNVTFAALVEAFGSPAGVFAASFDSLKVVPGIGDKTARQIKAFCDWTAVDKELTQARQDHVSIVTYKDPCYPSRLLNIYDFPPLLYVKGTLNNDDIPVAVVGSRQASTYGKFTTERLCRELAMKGITIVSGMARGIDSSAHSGALAGHGRTIAVLGSGLDVIYPPENETLFQKIATHGAVVSEFPLGTPPNAPNFPTRNRIISGISLGVVVIEAGNKSGSLITARIALEQGREVFAVPGAIDSPGSRGTHRLLKEGAKLIEGVDDIIDEILPQLLGGSLMPMKLNTPDRPTTEKPLPKACPDSLSEKEQRIFTILSSKPLGVNDIVRGTDLPVQEIATVLLQLEINGFIRQMPGNRYIREE